MASCEFCGGSVERRHHPTGRDEQGRYLDYEFVRDLCHDHHELVHDDSHTLGWEKLEGRPMTWFERIELRLRRWAAYLARLETGSSTPNTYGVLAVVLTRWADELARGIAVLDERFPSWRDDRGLYPD